MTMIGFHATILCGLLALSVAAGPAAQSPAAGSAGPRTITLGGKVVGDGAARSRITVYHSLGVRGSVEPVAGGATGRNAEFDLLEVPWFRGYDWRHNYVIVAAQAGNRVGLLQVRSDDRDARAEIQLRRTCSLRGVVREDPSGRPVVGASVWPMVFGDLDKKEPFVWPTAPMLPWHTLTDDEGRFELRDVPVYSCYVLDVSGPHHGRRLVRVHDRSRPTEVRLAPAGSIAGRVQLADGRPAVGLAIWTDGDGDGFARTRTDAAGRFSFQSLAAETYSVSTIVEEGPQVVATGIVLRTGSTVRDVDLRFPATGFVSGNLFDSASGERIQAGAMGYVASQGPTGREQRVDSSTRIRADGSYRIEVAPGRNRLTIVLPGWSVATVYADVRPDGETTLDVRLVRGSQPPRR